MSHEELSWGTSFAALGAVEDEPVVDETDLGVIAMEQQERSEREGRMIDLGTLSDGTAPDIWKGGASLQKRIDTGELDAARVEQHFAGLGRFYVPVTPGAPRRCVEDRTVQGYDPANPDHLGMQLGPQSQGGTVDLAYVTRLRKITDDRKAGREVDTTAAIEKDVAEEIKRDSPFAPGDHTDDRHAADKTGCGSVDGMSTKNERIATEPEVSAASASKANAVMGLVGLQLRDGFAKDLAESARTLQERIPGYFARINDTMDQITEACPTGKPTVAGPHKPGSLTINFVSGTTFHTSEYNLSTDDTLYNFNFDAWDIVEELPAEEAAIVIAQAVNTLTNLTDGSIRVFARLPQEAAA